MKAVMQKEIEEEQDGLANSFFLSLSLSFSLSFSLGLVLFSLSMNRSKINVVFFNLGLFQLNQVPCLMYNHDKVLYRTSSFGLKSGLINKL